MKKIINTIIAASITIICFAALFAVSWFTTAGATVLVGRCFGHGLTWLQGTGVWIALTLLSLYFALQRSVKK